MKAIRQTSRFRKDVKRIKKRGKDFTEFKRVIEKLAAGEQLDERYKDHVLVGPWKGVRDCHIEPDWLLLYQVDDNELILIRTGTHSDLFKK